MSPPLLLLLAALIVGVKAWHGWKLGAVRQAIGLVALALAALAAIVGGPLAEPFLDLTLPIPDEARAPVAGLALGLIVHVVLTFFGAVLFKKTEHQTVGVIRVGYGLIGALLGAVAGVVIAVALLVLVTTAQGNGELLEDLRAGEWESALQHLRPAAGPSGPLRK